ncbi:MAG TPA: ABC transporter substrate-binding protein, partial [Candidatus Limnocylindrales bacterium]
MSRTSRWSPLAAIGVVAIVFAACGGSATPPPSSASSAAPPASTAPASQAAVVAYPADADAPCGTAPYAGTIKRITALDAQTVEFKLCASDVAFLPKIAFASFGIQDADWLLKHAPDKSYLTSTNGTGPYKLKSWDKGNRVVMEAFADYWGTKALTPNFELRWGDTSAARLIDLQSGNVDGIDNPGIEEIKTIKADSSLAFYGRDPMNVAYLGFNHSKAPWSDEKVRQAIAMGIDRDRIVKNFYPDGSLVANKFT